jgi:transposase
MKSCEWARLLAYVSGLVNQELLLQIEYLSAENRILRAHAPVRLRLSNAERSTLAEIGKRLGRKGLEKVALVAGPDTILAWHRKLVAQKFDGSKHRSYPGRPRISAEVEKLIIQMAQENSGWGYDRIAGALANLGHSISDQTVGNVLRRHGIAPAPKRSQILRDGGVEPVRLPARSPDLNAFAERWVRSVKQECLSRLILFGEASLQRALTEYIAHFHGERNHQGKGNILLFPDASDRSVSESRVECKRRLGGLLRYYVRAA